MNQEYLDDETLYDVNGGSILTIQVAPGDTLGALAKKFRCTVEDLCCWNNIKNADHIEVGQKLKVKF